MRSILADQSAEANRDHDRDLGRESTIAFLIAIVLVVAFVGKLIAPDETLTALASFAGPSRTLLIGLYVVIMAVEACLIAGLLGLAGSHRHWYLAASAILFGLGALLTIFQWITGSTAGCGCGLPSFTSDPAADRIISLVRNIVLGSVAAWSAVLDRPSPRAS